MRRFIGALALGAVAVFGFGAQDARSAIVCTVAVNGADCTTTSSVETGAVVGSGVLGEFLGFLEPTPNPDFDDIIELKIEAGETVDGSDLFYFGKEEDGGADTAPLFDVTGLGATSGTFTYTGAATLDLLNVVLKYDAKDVPVWKLEDVQSGDVFAWATGDPNALSNIQFVATPIPGAVWLFGTALAGLGLFARRKIAA